MQPINCGQPSDVVTLGPPLTTDHYTAMRSSSDPYPTDPCKRFLTDVCVVARGQQRKRVDSQKWASAEEEDVTDGDLGLGKIAQLDICTGTAVCSNQASGGGVDPQEGEDNSE